MMFLVKLHFIDCVFTHSADSQRTNRNERFETQLFPLEWEFTEEGIEPLQVVNVYKSSEIKSRSGSKSDPKSEKEISDKKKGIPEPFISLDDANIKYNEYYEIKHVLRRILKDKSKIRIADIKRIQN